MDYFDVMRAKYMVLSVTGPYAGEAEGDISLRKSREINACGFTFWHHQSYQAKPDLVQRLGIQAESEGQKLYLVIMRTGTHGSGTDTKQSERATGYRVVNRGAYEPIPQDIYVETGKRPYALVIRDFSIIDEEIDLWEYSNFDNPDQAIVTRQGGSTVCVVRQFSGNNPERMKSHIRRVVTCAEIVQPYSVWLRA